MPTDEWFKENPKVSAYIPKELNDKLLEWMKGKNIKKVSQALTAILEEHLGVVQVEPKKPTTNDSGMIALEEKMNELSQEVRELREAITDIQNESSLKVDQSGQLSLLENNKADEKASSLKVEESSPILETIEAIELEVDKLIMTNKEVAALLSDKTDNAVRGLYNRGVVIEEKGYRFTPVKEQDKPRWKVEILGNPMLQEAPIVQYQSEL